MQGLVYRTEGAVGVALVNAIRGGTVSLLTGALFCSSAASNSCLNAWSACSAAVEITGGITWLTATHKVFKKLYDRYIDSDIDRDVVSNNGIERCCLPHCERLHD